MQQAIKFRKIQHKISTYCRINVKAKTTIFWCCTKPRKEKQLSIRAIKEHESPAWLWSTIIRMLVNLKNLNYVRCSARLLCSCTVAWCSCLPMVFQYIWGSKYTEKDHKDVHFWTQIWKNISLVDLGAPEASLDWFD